MEVAASVEWLLKGDAAQRIVAAWHYGWQPAREASGDVDDFILDLGDEDAFAAPEPVVAADDMLYAGSAPETEERKFFTEPEVSESPAPNAEAASGMLVQEPELAPEEVPVLTCDCSFHTAREFKYRHIHQHHNATDDETDQRH